MAKNKFYAVKNGRETGIFLTWEECEKNVKGVKNAVYKSFSTKKEAQQFLGIESEEKEKEKEKAKVIPSENTVYAYVDGSYNTKTKAYGYGVVLIFDNGETLTFNGCDNNGEIASMRNVAGELKGAMVAMQYAYNNEIEKLVIFHDYEGIAKWADGLWKTNLVHTKKYAEYVLKIRQRVDVTFEKVLAHSGDYYNEEVDALAKKAVGIL